MSFSRSRRKRKLKSPSKSVLDITLNDFANSENKPKAEVYRKKSGLKQLVEEVKSLTLNIENDTCEEESDLHIPKQYRKRKTKSIENSAVPTVGKEDTPIADDSQDKRPAIVFPVYLWSIIAEYIRPEDVGRFASICTASRAVVSSPDFWLRLRRRYVGRAYGGDKNNHALRPKVIRALKSSYEPLQARSPFFMLSQTAYMGHTTGGNSAYCDNVLWNCPSVERSGVTKFQSALVSRRRLRFMGDHHLVLGASCIQLWLEKRKDSWVYYIKLKHLTGDDGVSSHSINASMEDNTEITEEIDEIPECWMSMGEESCFEEHKKQDWDIWANPEEECKVLEIVLDKEQQLMNGHPPILGLSLVWACAKQASITSATSRHLALLFGPPHLSPRAATSLLSKLSAEWENCGGGWAEDGALNGSKRGASSCCKGSRGVGALSTHHDGMVPVVLPSVSAIRLLDWWDADYPYPGETRGDGRDACDEWT